MTFVFDSVLVASVPLNKSPHCQFFGIIMFIDSVSWLDLPHDSVPWKDLSVDSVSLYNSPH